LQQLVILPCFFVQQQIGLNLYVVKLPKEPRQIQQMSLFAASGQGKDASKDSLHCRFLLQQLVILPCFFVQQQIGLNLYVVKLPKEPRQIQQEQMSLFAASGQGKDGSKASLHCPFLSQQLVILLWFLVQQQIESNLNGVKLPKEPRQV
jgi:hypothetical protein